MQDRNNQSESFNTDSRSSDNNNMANKGHGAQGIDKAPGEETAQDLTQLSQETQRGKKVDRDMDQERDEPLEQ